MLQNRAKIVNIRIPKKNYMVISLAIARDGERTELGDNDLMYFSVKENLDDNLYKIQKTIGNGIEYNQDTGNYDITIESNDTANLKMNKNYGYDITIYYDGNKPSQQVIGTFRVTAKYTLNEVSVNE